MNNSGTTPNKRRVGRKSTNLQKNDTTTAPAKLPICDEIIEDIFLFESIDFILTNLQDMFIGYIQNSIKENAAGVDKEVVSTYSFMRYILNQFKLKEPEWESLKHIA